jgi:hypothetical protein
VARTIGELQAQVARQAQDLAFLRGIVQQSAGGSEVRVQRFRIVPASKPGAFQFRLDVAQPMHPEAQLSGALEFKVEGTGRDGKPASLALADLTGGALQELPFSFRYFTSIEQPITLPAGFRPAQVSVTVRPARKGVAPVTQSFVWTVDAS